MSPPGPAAEGGDNPITFGAATPDGKTVAFLTREKITPDDDDRLLDAYRSTPAGVFLVMPGTRADRFTVEGISGNGSTVHLETAEVLSPADIDEHADLYSASADRLPAGVNRPDGRDLGKPGAEEAPPRGVVSQRQVLVLFTTAVPLVGADTDEQIDVLPARKLPDPVAHLEPPDRQRPA